MCFRPAEASMAINCPGCGKKVNEVMGNYPTECPFCNEDLTSLIPNSAAGAPPMPAAPSMPSAPGAPSAPIAPQA